MPPKPRRKASRGKWVIGSKPKRKPVGRAVRAWGISYKGILLGSAWPIHQHEEAKDDADFQAGEVVPVLITEIGKR